MQQGKGFLTKLLRDRQLYLLLLPGLVFFLIFKYTPLWGLIIAFQEYSPFAGVWGSPWVGLEHFTRFFSHDTFWILLRNTLSISLLSLVLFFPAPILLSLMLNEVGNRGFKKISQTVIYFPHFLSWVIIYGITYVLLNQTDGIINQLIKLTGSGPVPFMTSTNGFYPLIVLQNIWKDAGWGTVIFLAALSGIDPELYEAAKIDGAGRFRRIWAITLPGIRNVIMVLLILKLGQVLDVGFEQVFLMSNAAVSDIADIFDTYVYRNGVLEGNFSFAAAVGLFKSIVATVLVISANKFSKKFGNEGLY